MKTLTKTSLLLLLVSSLGACAAPSDGEEVSESEDSLSRTVKLPNGTDLSKLPPLVLDPDVSTSEARITGSDLYGALVWVLGGTKLVIDTTGVSPTIPSEPFYHCTYPNQQIREEMTADCMRMAGTAKSQCLKMMNEEYPNIKECNMTTGPVHSYIDFGPLAESNGAKDHPFEGITTIHRDTFGPGGITVDINYVHTTVGPSTIDAEWTNAPNKPSASITLKLESNQPTLPCAHTEVYLGCPDVELTNMKVNAQLAGIKPTADKTQLAFDEVIASFTFNRNLNNIPDALLTTFVDIDQIIKNNVNRNVKKALEKYESRNALYKALTTLAEQSAKKNHASWKGFKSIESASVDPATNELVFKYVPN